jgi:hypothetical protein
MLLLNNPKLTTFEKKTQIFKIKKIKHLKIWKNGKMEFFLKKSGKVFIFFCFVLHSMCSKWEEAPHMSIV